MLCTTHTLAVLLEGWAAITETADAWDAFFASQAYPLVIPRGQTEPVVASRVLYGVFTDKPPAFDPGVVFGRAKSPAVYLTAGDERVINEAIGQNFNPAETAWGEESATVTIEIQANTRVECEALHIACKGIMLRAKHKLCATIADGGYNYMNVTQVGSQGPRAFDAITKEGFGGFRALVRCAFERHDEYPPILGPAITPAYLSIHAFDATDQWGNHGKVKPAAPEE